MMLTNKNEKEELIADISYIRNLVRSLRSSIYEIDRQIQREDEAIRNSDIKIIEAVIAMKHTISIQIEKDIVDFKNRIARLQKYSFFDYLKSSRTIEASNLIDGFESIIQIQDRMTAVSQILYQQSWQAIEEINQLIDQRKAIQPKIESNTYLIHRLLIHHQETYRFWQSVARDSESVYGSHGRTKSHQSQSMLEVKT